MATWQFDSHLNPEGAVVVPPDVAAQLQSREPLKVILSTDTETADWQRITAEQLLQGYSASDDIYDQLPNR